MKKVTIKMDTLNSAFVPTTEIEIVRILRKLADDIENNGIGDKQLMDINGNKVGMFITN